MGVRKQILTKQTGTNNSVHSAATKVTSLETWLFGQRDLSRKVGSTWNGNSYWLLSAHASFDLVLATERGWKVASRKSRRCKKSHFSRKVACPEKWLFEKGGLSKRAHGSARKATLRKKLLFERRVVSRKIFSSKVAFREEWLFMKWLSENNACAAPREFLSLLRREGLGWTEDGGQPFA